MMERVETATGIVEGTETAGVDAFVGVPYAAAPDGDLRLRAPRPPEPWAGVRPATTFGPWAPQNPPRSMLTGLPPAAQAEDCLTLNVWTPGLDGARRPVMVWIHGGAFTGGSGASVLYRGDRLSRRGDVVVVTLNYRLGVLGFAAHPALRDDSAGGVAGNWGLLDQVAALRWVRDNISAFGGDPSNVTAFGESAGAMSVCDLLAMPAASGLFHKAIAQSGPPDAQPMQRAEEATAKLAADLGLSSPEELRSCPLPALLDAQARLLSERGAGPLPFRPVVDGASLPGPPLPAIVGGRAADVPLLIGTNRDEAKMFMVEDPGSRDPDDELALRRIGRAFQAGNVRIDPAEAMAAYRAARAARRQRTDPRELWSAIETDRVFRVGSLRAAEAHARRQPRTYCYLFTWDSPALGGALGACHALDLPFVFGTLDAPGMERFAGRGPAAEHLSNQMMDSWVAFARGADPSHPGVGEWPAYDTGRRSTMVFGADTHVEDAPYEEERRFWEDRR